MTDEYHARCCVCGIALSKDQLRAALEGVYTDYRERDGGSMRINFCDEHWDRICEVTDEEFEKAAERAERLKEANGDL